MPLAALTFFGAFIPIVGTLVAGVAVVLVALVDGGVTQALLATAIVIVVQQLESNLLAPVVLGRTLPLHPLVVLHAVTAGVVLAGIIGALIAVPLAATVTAAISELRVRRAPPEPAVADAFPGDRLRAAGGQPEIPATGSGDRARDPVAVAPDEISGAEEPGRGAAL